MKQDAQNYTVKIIGDLDLFSQLLNEWMDGDSLESAWENNVVLKAMAHMRMAVAHLKSLEPEEVFEYGDRWYNQRNRNASHDESPSAGPSANRELKP